MKELSYKDRLNRTWYVKLPEGIPDSDAPLGIPIGPPSLESLGLPEEIEIALHNQLAARRIFTARDVKIHRAEVSAAIQGALKLDTERIYTLYLSWENGSSA